jgi:hypothetical protein
MLVKANRRFSISPSVTMFIRNRLQSGRCGFWSMDIFSKDRRVDQALSGKDLHTKIAQLSMENVC